MQQEGKRQEPLIYDYLLIGGGLASVTAAETLRREGADGSILILSAEQELPYHRPALSKQYLLGRADRSQILIHPRHFYDDNQIDIMQGMSARFIDADAQHVFTATGLQLSYKKLLIATGAHPRQLQAHGAHLAGIHALRSIQDCDAIRYQLSTVKTVVVVGGSFQGLEIAMSLLEQGLDVTVVEEKAHLLKHLESAQLSTFFREYAQNAGVKIRLQDAAIAFHGQDSVTAVETESGTRIPCELVIVCAGVEPATSFLEGSGITTVEGRVLVDEQLSTNVPGVFAAGDVACFHDPVFQRLRHIEHWDNAIRQGRLAARNMLGKRLRYDEVSYFFCEVGDISFDVLGDPTGANDRVTRGSLANHSYAEFYLQDNILKSAFSFGRSTHETKLTESLIRYRVNLHKDKSKLGDPQFALDQLASQNVLILQGGGALGAFECGVVKALEERSIHPDIVAGISIGALNGAIIAGNPHNATAALESFWEELQIDTPWASSEPLRQAMTAIQILQFGVPKFFRPNWLPSMGSMWQAPWEWTAFYDTSPMRQLLEKYVDFSTLKASPVRLLVGAVNVLTAELEVFDSYIDDLTPDHILASGSLPPGFSWTKVNDVPYWDGGIVSNSPLDLVIDRCGPDGKRVFIVDLFSGEKELPSNLFEVMARRDEIVYSERVRNDLRMRELKDSFRRLVKSIMNEVEPSVRDKIRQRPRFIQLMGDGAPMNITRFVRKGHSGEPSSRDYDFSEVAITENRQRGYELAVEVLSAKTMAPSDAEHNDHDFHDKPQAVMRQEPS